MILLIDATVEPVRIGLAEQGKSVTMKEIPERRQLSARLLGKIERLLSGAELAPADLEAIAVVRGPGPFTSLRISLAVANALAGATDRPLVGLEPTESWSALVTTASQRLADGHVARQLRPEYGRPPSISRPAAK